MPYYPKSRIIENRQANQGEFTLPDGREYTGPYYTTFDGQSFTGANPFTINSRPLIPRISSNNEGNIIQNENLEIFNSLNPLNLSLIDPTPFTPTPTLEDYRAGKITRYFARQRNGKQFRIMEINKETFDALNNRSKGLNTSLWKTISIFWQISGPDRTQVVNGIRRQAGIIDTNQRVLDNAEKNFIGIKQYLTDLKQFAK
jgi:hypothetical protein